MTAPLPTAARAPIVAERSTLRAVAMPSEHGGWSLTLEPVLLGLIVAWSWPGLAIGAAAMLAFVARTPLKLVLVDRWRRRSRERTHVAARVAVIELIVFAVLVAAATLGPDHRFWVPALAASPLIVIELWFDMRSRGRRLLPELVGAIGIGSTAAAVALAGGAAIDLAIGPWVIVAARAVAAIPYARTQVFRTRNKPYHAWHSDLAQACALVAATITWLVGAIPSASVMAIAVVTTFNIGAIRATSRPAKVIGLQQVLRHRRGRRHSRCRTRLTTARALPRSSTRRSDTSRELADRYSSGTACSSPIRQHRRHDNESLT